MAETDEGVLVKLELDGTEIVAETEDYDGTGVGA